MGKPAKPLRVIELITLLVIAGICTAVILPRCQNRNAPNQSTPSAEPTSAKPN